jgi:hypothetical protein
MINLQCGLLLRAGTADMVDGRSQSSDVEVEPFTHTGLIAHFGFMHLFAHILVQLGKNFLLTCEFFQGGDGLLFVHGFWDG